MLDTAKRFLGEVVDIGLSLIAVAVVLQVVFGQAIPFLGGDVLGGGVVTNLLDIITRLGDQGLVGLIAVTIILYLINKNS